MKKIKILIILSIVIFSSFLFASPAHAAPTYFGFFDGFGGPLGVDRYKTYVNTVLSGSGTRASTDPAGMANAYITELNQLSPAGIKPIIDVSSLFFDWKTGGVNGRTAFLRSDYQTRWNQFWQTISPHRTKILGFYPLDEPNAWTTCNEFTAATNAMRASAPEISILELIDGPGMAGWTKNPREGWLNSDGDFCIPPSVNWLAFDDYCYNNSGACAGGVPLENKLGFLNTIAIYRPWSSGQRRQTFVIPEAFFASSICPDLSKDQQRFINALQWYYNFCQGASQCIGVLPFMWPKNPDGGSLCGVDAMPSLEAAMKAVGAQISQKTLSPTLPPITLPIPGDINQDGQVNILDLRQLKTSFTNISAYSQMVTNYGK